MFGKDVVYDVPNDLFMEQKKSAKVGLSTENFRAYVGMIEEEVEDFLKSDPAFSVFQSNNEEWGQFDALKILQAITIFTASRTLQGKEVRARLDKSIADVYHDLDGGFTPINFLFPNLPLPSYRRRDVAQKKMSDFFMNIIQERRNNTALDVSPLSLWLIEASLCIPIQNEHDMIAVLMQTKYRSGRPFQDHEIAHLMIAMLMAGQHTSSSTGAWALLHLGNRPDIA